MLTQEAFLQIIRLGIGHKSYFSQEDIDWDKIEKIAYRQGLLAIVLDGIEQMPESQRPPKKCLLDWIGEVLQGYEVRYADYCSKIGQLAEFYRDHGFKMMVLKGLGLSLNYPKPSHRPCGDIDIWQFGQHKVADMVIHQSLGIEIDKCHHHHTVFNWRGYSVENHYDFVNVHYGHKNKELEAVFKELAKDDSNRVEIEGQIVYLPSVNLHALFLLRHCMHDFAASEMSIRQVLDWAFFLEKHTKELDWGWFVEVLKMFKMMDFFNCLNAICVEDLGFDVKLFSTVQFDPIMKGRVLKEILEPSFTREEPERLLSRLVYKYHRWQGNAWKQNFCYGDSRFIALFTGIWNHLLKPSSI